MLTPSINMVFNVVMNDDRTLIDRLGGPARVAELLGYEKAGGVQRVHNWRARGIPSHVKVSRPDLFMPQVKADEPAAPVAPTAAA